MKPWVCRLLGVLCAALSWALGLSFTRSTSWHLWEFRSDSVPFVSIGIWEAIYYQRVNVSGPTGGAHAQPGRPAGLGPAGSREPHALGSKAAAAFLTLSGCCTLIAVTWNAAADERGYSALDFPLHFPVAKASRARAHGSACTCYRWAWPWPHCRWPVPLCSSGRPAWRSGGNLWLPEQTTWADSPAPWAESPPPGLRTTPPELRAPPTCFWKIS
nr:uncharacterized protein LOC127489015 [Oryctolagus cuniculus]